MEDAASALVRMMGVFARGADGGWAREVEGVTAMVTGFPDPMLNAVLAVTRSGAESELLAEVARTGLPYCLETRTPDPVDEMVAVATVPVMVLDSPALLSTGNLSIRALGPEEIGLHLDCLATSVGVDRSYFAALEGGGLLRQEGVTAYLATVDDEPVATGVGIRSGEFVGIFNMGTPEKHRRQGFGAAVASRIVLDGFAHGAAGAVLQASPLGRGIYERLGFSRMELWTVWLPLRQT